MFFYQKKDVCSKFFLSYSLTLLQCVFLLAESKFMMIYCRYLSIVDKLFSPGR